MKAAGMEPADFGYKGKHFLLNGKHLYGFLYKICRLYRKKGRSDSF